MRSMLVVLVVAIGGALGAVARLGLVRVATWSGGTNFPYGTLLVNVLGCFAMGIAFGVLQRVTSQSLTPDETATVVDSARLGLFNDRELWLRYGVMVGFLGAFTTFSAFSLETLALLTESNTIAALANVAANVLLCITAVWLGSRCTQWC